MSYTVNKHYFLWIREHCPFCKKAQALLGENELTHTVYAMDQYPEKLKEVKDKFDWQTVPIIFEVTSDGDCKLIGGFTDIKKHLEKIDD
tara:strand:+ start:142 stop:408 length:267 start_codon:yes stop_codon:yes gene_type:complete